MARVLTPNDAYALMNALVKQATGQSALAVTDTSSFVSAGETVLATGKENTLNSLAIVMGKTFMAVRPYKAKLNIINAINTALYSNRLRKISFYSREAQAAGDWNTDIKTNFLTGYDNGTNGGQSVASMWEQNAPVPLEMNFGGQSVWDEETTVYENQLKVAFTNEAEFMSFVSGIMTEKGNDIESTKEAFNRLTILNKIAGIYDMSAVMPGSVVNLTAAYNAKFGTSYTSAQLRTTYLQSFLQFFTATFKLSSDLLTHRSAKYHYSPAKTVAGTAYTLLRHTPKDRQRAILYAPLFLDAKAQVFSEIFNPEYLEDGAQHELVDYWQAFNTPSAINITPAVIDTSAAATAGTQIAGSAVSLDYVVGILYDVDAMMVDYQFEGSNTTPIEARKRYHNIFWHFSKNAINDPTENAIIFIMAD